MINFFSPETIAKIKHYVYRLIDPINGQTFYVGEGQGNRVFDHVNAVDKSSFYSKNNNSLTIQDKQTDEDKDPAKIDRIISIKSKGLNVIHVIQRWGMDQHTAFEVEAAFIDYFGLKQLTNKQKGHDYERGMRYVDELEQEFTAEPFVEDEKYPFILIKITDYYINLNGGKENNGIYKTVKEWWKIDPNKANNYPYVLAVLHGIVVEVYKINENGWKRKEKHGRAYFDGVIAPEEVRSIFINKRIPDKYRKKGASFPCLYYRPDKE